MTYKTLVASSATQQRWSYESSANTLEELKQEFRNNGIPYEGLGITEGLSTKALLTRDDAELPTSSRTVNYNGETYNRVFLITNTSKNIASGILSRKDAYEMIKKLNLQEKIKALYGRNFTQVGTDDLTDAIAAEQIANTKAAQPESASASKLPDIKSAPHPDTVEWYFMGIKAMVKSGLLYNDDVAVLADLITDYYNRLKVDTLELSDADIDNMIASI